MTLREITIITPTTPTQGAALHPREYGEVITRLEKRLLDHFGGFTCTYGQGVWRDHEANRDCHETVFIFKVAIAVYGLADASARQIAQAYGHEGAQACVYYRDTSGEVHFLHPAAWSAGVPRAAD